VGNPEVAVAQILGLALVTAGPEIQSEIQSALPEVESLIPELEQVVINRNAGRLFQEIVQKFLGLTENFQVIAGQTLKGNPLSSRPDLLSITNLTEIKEVLRLALSPQIQSEIYAAQMRGIPYSVIASVRNFYASRPLLDAITNAGGFFVRFNPVITQFTEYYDPSVGKFLPFEF
jgi:hypothetical protein